MKQDSEELNDYLDSSCCLYDRMTPDEEKQHYQQLKNRVNHTLIDAQRSYVKQKLVNNDLGVSDDDYSFITQSKVMGRTVQSNLLLNVATGSKNINQLIKHYRMKKKYGFIEQQENIQKIRRQIWVKSEKNDWIQVMQTEMNKILHPQETRRSKIGDNTGIKKPSEQNKNMNKNMNNKIIPVVKVKQKVIQNLKNKAKLSNQKVMKEIQQEDDDEYDQHSRRKFSVSSFIKIFQKNQGSQEQQGGKSSPLAIKSLRSNFKILRRDKTQNKKTKFSEIKKSYKLQRQGSKTPSSGATVHSIMKQRAQNQTGLLSESVTQPHLISDNKTDQCVEINKRPDICTKDHYSVDKARISKSPKFFSNTKTNASTKLSRDHDNKLLPMLSPKSPLLHQKSSQSKLENMCLKRNKSQAFFQQFAHLDKMKTLDQIKVSVHSPVQADYHKLTLQKIKKPVKFNEFQLNKGLLRFNTNQFNLPKIGRSLHNQRNSTQMMNQDNSFL